MNILKLGNFTKMAITQEVNKISSPNSIDMCMRTVCGHCKNTASIGHMVAL